MEGRLDQDGTYHERSMNHGDKQENAVVSVNERAVEIEIKTQSSQGVNVNPHNECNQQNANPPISHAIVRSEVRDSYLAPRQRKNERQTGHQNSLYERRGSHREDKILFIKYDNSVFESDLESLNGWLSDTIVSFAALHLFDNLPPEFKKQVNIIPSASCDIIKYTNSSQLSATLFNLDIVPKKWQFFLFNNNSDFGNNPGSHWSLLIFNKNNQMFFHADSIGGYYVPRQIQEFARKIKNVLHISLPEDFEVLNIDCPKMRYGGECGIYLIEYVKAILENIMTNRAWYDFSDMTHKYMSRRRAYWKQIIWDLANENKQAMAAAPNNPQMLQPRDIDVSAAPSSSSSRMASHHRRYPSENERNANAAPPLSKRYKSDSHLGKDASSFDGTKEGASRDSTHFDGHGK